MQHCNNFLTNSLFTDVPRDDLFLDPRESDYSVMVNMCGSDVLLSFLQLHGGPFLLVLIGDVDVAPTNRQLDGLQSRTIIDDSLDDCGVDVVKFGSSRQFVLQEAFVLGYTSRVPPDEIDSSIHHEYHRLHQRLLDFKIQKGLGRVVPTLAE